MADFTSSRLIVLVIVVAIAVSGDKITDRCKYSDKPCILAAAKKALPKILGGIPELGIPASDPLYVKHIRGDLSTMKFTYDDGVVKGFKNCDVKDIDINIEKGLLKIVNICANTEYMGNYTVSGRLIVLPVEGTGTFYIIAHKYEMVTNAELKKVKGKDGKEYLTIKNFKGTSDAVEPMIFHLTNLFNGRKDLSDVFHKFANENYREVSAFAYEPIYNDVFKNIFKNVNKFLKTVPLDELFLE